MNKKLLTLGVILLVGGMLLIFASVGLGNNYTRKYQYNILYGDYDYNSYMEDIAFAGLLVLISLITIITSFIIMIVGVFQGGKPELLKQQYSGNDKDRRCPHCGRVIPIDSKSCPYCSIEFEKIAKNEDNLSSKEILKQRFAKGEITEEEFEKMKKKLEG